MRKLRWQITEAVRRSELPAPSRLIMFVLADMANVGTAEIPPQFSPSLTVLARETGLGRSTVAEHLSKLEEAGWLKRSQPSKLAQGMQERTCYFLKLPDHIAQEEDFSSPGAGLDPVQEPESPSGNWTTPVQEPDGPSPDAGHVINRKSDPSQINQITDRNINDLEAHHDHTYVCGDLGYRCLNKNPDFQAFWNAYPLRVGLGEVRPAYAEATRLGADPEALTAGAIAYRNDPNRKSEYTMKPANWLRDERWLDQRPVSPPRRHRVEGW